MITVERPQWSGTATELVSQLELDMKANSLSKRLNVKASRLENEYGVCYKNSRTRNERTIQLTLLPPKRDDSDGCDDEIASV